MTTEERLDALMDAEVALGDSSITWEEYKRRIIKLRRPPAEAERCEPKCACFYRDDAYKAPEQHQRGCPIREQVVARPVAPESRDEGGTAVNGEKSMAQNAADAQVLRGVVTRLREQCAAKDAEIERLRAESDALKRDLAAARERVEEEQSKRGACERVIAEQQRILCKLEPDRDALRARLAAAEAREDEAAWVFARWLAPWASCGHGDYLDNIERDTRTWLAARGGR